MADSAVLQTSEKTKHEFHAEGFDGPLDLLLFLISENKINIYNIDVSLITEQFLQYIADHEAELDELADFYKMAADLLYIKSRMLLPVTTALDEEYEDPRQELVERLLEYQKYKRYTDLLLSGGGADRLYIRRNENFFAVPFEDKDLFEGVDVNMLLKAFVALANRTAPAKIFNLYEEVSINEKKTLLTELLDQKEEVTIEELIVHLDDKMHIICSIMAVLEMTKEHLILITQKVEFGPIYIQRRPQDWDPTLADEYDDEYDAMVLHAAKGRPMDYSILTKEAETVIREAEEEEKEEAPPEFVGEEEEIDLGEEDDEE